MTDSTHATKNLSQQEFLRKAASDLGLNLTEFARRIGAPQSTFEKWMADPNASRYREMPAIAWSLVREVLAHEALRKKVSR
ncbi:MAG: transcriptional regulator [Betaproteobacteria bacterium HGW-Betaproteobacteria-17]|nr:MAG: transcriptional regulator [Betaproteobacteria bacterium HGW-Betaproteobacteria-17]